MSSLRVRHGAAVVHAQAWSDVPMSALVEALQSGGAVLTSSADRYGVWLVGSNGATDHDGHQLDPQGVFEARGFDGTVDARWHGATGGVGTLVVLSLSPIERAGGRDVSRNDIEAVIEGTTYLLLGERSDDIGAWATSSAASFGQLHVPAPDGAGRLVLRVNELVAFDEDGNADVVDELIIGFDTLEGRS